MIVVAKLKAKAGQESAMENALRGVIASVDKEEGTLIYTLHRSQKDAGLFLFYEKYKNAEALMEHSATPHFKALFKTLKPLLWAAVLILALV